MPFPGGADNLFELRVFRFPPEFLARFIGGGDQCRRIAGTPRFFDNRNFLATDLFAHGDDLAHGITVAIAKVVEAAFARRHCQDVRLGEVDNVDVVADARAIRCGIIRAINLACEACPSGTFSTLGMRCVSMR